MQTCVYLMGIILAGQVAGSGGDRYAQPVLPSEATGQGASSSPFAETTPPQTDSPLESQPATNPLRTSTPPETTTNTTTPATGIPGMTTPPASSAPPANSAPRTTSPPASSAPPARLTKVQKPADLLKNLLTPAPQQKLIGASFSLADAVEGTQSRLQQSKRVTLYWDLSRAVAEYYLTVREELDIQSQRNGLLQAGQAWTIAQENAAARRKMAMSAVKVAQLRLQKACGRAGDAALPVPTDLPHCGTYKSKYNQIFKSRTSREAAQLADLLPLRHQELNHLSSETTEALNWHTRVGQQRSVQNGATLLLKAYEQLALQRRAFVNAAYQYNAEIARYTELAVPQDVAPVQLVAMLIQTDAKWQAGAIRRASAEEASGSGTSAPRTFRGDSRSRTLRVPAEDADGEHSILVKPGSGAK